MTENIITNIMKAGFKVETRVCDSWDKFLVVTNITLVI